MEKMFINKLDKIECLCGNSEAIDGFYKCLANGTYIFPIHEKEWLNLYFCPSCGRIFNYNTLTVVNYMNKDKLRIENLRI